ncbi:MAG TPA: TonB family protein [Kofleriaceae bacterium]
MVAACGGAQTQGSQGNVTFKSSELRAGSDGTRPMIAPNRLEALRTAGDLVIKPDDMQSRKAKFKFCVDVTGKVGDIEQLQSSGDGRYDAKIERAMQRWAYRPVIVDGQPTAVCSEIGFVYTHR